MDQKTPRNIPSNSLLDGIQAEVSAENAPLLQFITAHAGKIAGLIIVLLLALGCVGLWNWYHDRQQSEVQVELARINAQLQGADKDKALAALAEKAPRGSRLYIYMSLGQSAIENNNPALAAEAYAKAASLAGDGPLATAVLIGNAGSLLMQDKFTEALRLLQDASARIPAAATSTQFRQMLAEAASRAGDLVLAQKTYADLASEISTPQKDYFRTRADALAARIEDLKAAKK